MKKILALALVIAAFGASAHAEKPAAAKDAPAKKTKAVVVLDKRKPAVPARSSKNPRGTAGKQSAGTDRCYCDVSTTPNKGCSDDTKAACQTDPGCKWTCVHLDDDGGASSSATQ